MPKTYATKLPDGMAAAFDAWLEENDQKAYTFFQQAAERVLTVIPKIPKKPPPLPVKKTRPARMITELARRMNRLLSEGISKDDEVLAALTREILEASADLPCWDETRRDELRQIQWRLTERVQVLDTFERGVLDAADEEWRASLPTLRPGSATPED